MIKMLDAIEAGMSYCINMRRLVAFATGKNLKAVNGLVQLKTRAYLHANLPVALYP